MTRKFKIFDTIEYSGLWWIIGEEDKRISGVLKRSVEDQIRLEISGDFDDESSLITGLAKGELPIVLGDCYNGIVTLVNCVATWSGTRFAFEENSKKKVTMIFEHIIVGKHYKSVSDIKFSSIDAEFSTLKYWMDLSPFKIDILGEVTLIKEENNLALNVYINEYKMRLTTGYGVEEVSDNYESEGVKYTYYLNIEPDEKQSLEWYLKVVGKFNQFLSVYTDSITVTLSLSGTPDHKRGDNKSFPICEIPYQGYSDGEKRGRFEAFTVSIYNMRDNIEEILNKWFSLNHDEILYTYIGNIPHDNRTIQEKFLGYAKIIESLHRFQDNGVQTTFIDPLRYEEIIKKVLVTLENEIDVDNNLRNKISDTLKYANEHGFQRRIKEVLKSVPENLSKAICFGMKPAKYADSVRINRDYYTHFHEKSSSGILSDYEMIAMNFSLKVLSLWMISRKIGINTNVLEHAFMHRGHWINVLLRFGVERFGVDPNELKRHNNDPIVTAEQRQMMLDKLQGNSGAKD